MSGKLFVLYYHIGCRQEKPLRLEMGPEREQAMRRRDELTFGQRCHLYRNNIHTTLTWGQVIMSKRVLICDDSLLMRKMVSETLIASGWEVVGEASNGQEAFEKFQELLPDAVTMDIVMPEFDGIHGLRKIMEFDPDAKVVMVSALSQTNKISEAVRSGAQDFIVKPFMPEQLQETLDACLGQTTV